MKYRHAFRPRSTVYAHHSAIVLLRVTDDSGERLTPEDITEVRYTIFNVGDSLEGTSVTGHVDVEIPVAESVLSDYATWERDSIGYNLKIPIPHTVCDPFPDRGSQYRLDVRISTVGYHILTTFMVVAI